MLSSRNYGTYRRDLILQKSTLDFERKEIKTSDISEELINDIPEDLINVILLSVKLSDINKMKLLNKNWYAFVRDNEIFLCKEIFHKFQLQPTDEERKLCKKVLHKLPGRKEPPSKKEIKDLIQSTKEHLQMIFSEHFQKIFPMDTLKTSLKNELDQRLANVKIEKIHEFQEIYQARDILIVWGYLQKKCNEKGLELQLPLDLQNFDSVKELIDMAKGFQDWCQTNQNHLLLLQTLTLSRYELTSVPDEIWQLTNLQLLNLSNNRLTSVSDKIEGLKNLKVLNLGKNLLASIPDSIWSLTNLEKLDFSNNFLTSISENIGLLKKLSLIGLMLNPLITLPKVLGALKSKGLTISIEPKKEFMFS